jgi:hypothetical protein
MALFTLEALVLRGVVVLRDGVAVNLRLGTSVQGAKQAPEIASSPRPLPTCWPMPNPGNGQAGDAGHADYRVAGTAPGAGRSRSLVGTRSTSHTSTRFGRRLAKGGTATAAATRSGQIQARTVAPVGEVALPACVCSRSWERGER